jgi:hypothetical protein
MEQDLSQLETQYNQTCSKLEKENLDSNKKVIDAFNADLLDNPYKFSEEEIAQNDKELSEITPWMRKPIEKFSYKRNDFKHQQRRKFRIFSLFGMLVLFTLGFLSITTCYAALTSFMIFYCPRIIQKQYQRVTKTPCDTSEFKDFSEYPYFI